MRGGWVDGFICLSSNQMLITEKERLGGELPPLRMHRHIELFLESYLFEVMIGGCIAMINQFIIISIHESSLFF